MRENIPAPGHRDELESGLTLVMTVTVNETLVSAHSSVDLEADLSGQRLTEACFAQTWQDMALIFQLEPEPGKEETR